MLIFEDFCSKCANLIKVDLLLDSELVDKLIIPELNYKISEVGEN